MKEKKVEIWRKNNASKNFFLFRSAERERKKNLFLHSWSALSSLFLSGIFWQMCVRVCFFLFFLWCCPTSLHATTNSACIHLTSHISHLSSLLHIVLVMSPMLEGGKKFQQPQHAKEKRIALCATKKCVCVYSMFSKKITDVYYSFPCQLGEEVFFKEKTYFFLAHTISRNLIYCTVHELYSRLLLSLLPSSERLKCLLLLGKNVWKRNELVSRGRGREAITKEEKMIFTCTHDPEKPKMVTQPTLVSLGAHHRWRH